MTSTLQPGVACWPAPAPSVTPGRALFAKGLAKGCTSAHLQSIFSAFGTVTDCQIARHRSGRSAGFAIVTFLRHEEAVAAMQAMDNFLYMGRRLSVKWFSPERALEGGSHGAEALNMQAFQHALQLSAQLQPADLMALAQMLESPRIVPQQPQNPHVAAWLDNFILAQQQRDSPLAAPQLHDPSQQPTQMDLNLSALSLTDLPANLAVSQVPGYATHPATPSSLDLPDGAVFVTANAQAAGHKGVVGGMMGGGVVGHGSGGGHHRLHLQYSQQQQQPHSAPATAGSTAAPQQGTSLTFATSRLAKWCTAPGPGSAGGRSSAAQSLADDASSDETASVHASDDSSIATTSIAQTAPHVSCDAPSCSTEGSSPAGPHLVLSDPGAAAAAVAVAAAAAAAGGVASPASVGAAIHINSPVAPPGTPSSAMAQESDDLLRSRAYAAAAAAAVANSRPGVVGSDPGTMQQALGRAGGAAGFPGAPVLPGVPALPPLRTVATAPPAGMPHHLARGAMAAPAQGRPSVPVFNSCGGGASGAAPPSASPDSCLQQALRLQQALAEQARTVSAQQQYVDALAKLAAAREQVMAAASLLSGSTTGGMPGNGLPVQHTPHHHHHSHMMGAPSLAAPQPASAGPMGAYLQSMTAAAGPAGVTQYLAQSQPAQGPVASSMAPDLSALLMLQNAAMNRPLY